MTPMIDRLHAAARGDSLRLLLLWGMLVLVAMAIYRPEIAAMTLVDPDDWLRLVQVRDLLAGQSFHDLTQYRVNPGGGGGLVHWSRFIDVQIAGLILLLQPLFGAAEAERWAVTFYPMLLLLPLFWLLRRILMRLDDQPTFVWLGLLMAVSSPNILYLFAPLRIDHHNWQLILSVAMLWLALGPATFARGLTAALVISVHVEISLEGLPYLVMFGALFAYDWLRDPATAARLRGFALGLVGIPLVWTLALRGSESAWAVSCDSFSRPFLLGAAVTGGLLAAQMLRGRDHGSLMSRLVMLGIAGAGGLLVFASSGPGCLAGPFGDLSPLVRDHWYYQISEGRPLWEQPVAVMVTLTVTSLVGLLALFRAPRHFANAAATDWRRLALMAMASFILSLLVLRTTAVTHVYVLPGYALLALGFLRWARALEWTAFRVPATAATVLIFPVSVLTLAAAAPVPRVPPTVSAVAGTCLSRPAAAKLGTLPPAIILVTLDTAPELLAKTPHRVFATGHHRNYRQIDQVMRAFLAPPATAEALVRATRASYLLTCSHLAEIRYLAHLAPDGLAAHLVANRPPTWLALDSRHSSGGMRLYRLLTPGQIAAAADGPSALQGSPETAVKGTFRP